jgi:hypothetical protein
MPAPVEVSNLRPGFFIGAKVEAGLDADELSEMELPIVIAVVCLDLRFARRWGGAGSRRHRLTGATTQLLVKVRHGRAHHDHRNPNFGHVG